MLLSVKWLQDYIAQSTSAKELAELLTMSGSEVERETKIGKDTVFELEITPNRTDCLSMIGLAREVAALTNHKVNIPRAYTTIPKEITSKDKKWKIDICDPEISSHYSARAIYDVKIKPAPKDLLNKLESINQRGINNAVDIINFCLFESGQPMHVFDMDKISGDTIFIRRSKKGEEITTLDDVHRPLPIGTPVIADAAGPLAIAGIKGGNRAEVTSSTKNILLESAYFNPVVVRTFSRKLGLSSDSSYRFERGVDQGNIIAASQRALELILKDAGGKAGSLFQAGSKKVHKKTIIVDVNHINDLLGSDIKKSFVDTRLARLGLTKKASKGSTSVFEVPTFRRDLKEPVDLAEEVARIYGYDNIPSTIPPIIGDTNQVSSKRQIIDKAKRTLIGNGFQEILSYSLISQKEKEILYDGDIKDVVELMNPLSREHAILRPNLWPGMLKAIDHNLRHNEKNLFFFEISSTYKRIKREKYIEKQSLVAAISNLEGHVIGDKISEKDQYFILKGAVENLFSELKLELISFKPISKDKLLAYGAQIICKNKECGKIGLVKEEILKSSGIKEKIFLADIDFEFILKHIKLERKIKPLRKFQSVRRDISLVIAKKTSYEEIKSGILNFHNHFVDDVIFLSSYEGESIPEGYINLLIRVEYYNHQKTLTDQEVNKRHEALKNHLITLYPKISYR